MRAPPPTHTSDPASWSPEWKARVTFRQAHPTSWGPRSAWRLLLFLLCVCYLHKGSMAPRLPRWHWPFSWSSSLTAGELLCFQLLGKHLFPTDNLESTTSHFEGGDVTTMAEPEAMNHHKMKKCVACPAGRLVWAEYTGLTGSHRGEKKWDSGVHSASWPIRLLDFPGSAYFFEPCTLLR